MSAKTEGELIAEIAKRMLGIETLEQRNSDSLDFHEVAVWQVRAALEAAYRAGAASTGSASPKGGTSPPQS